MRPGADAAVHRPPPRPDAITRPGSLTALIPTSGATPEHSDPRGSTPSPRSWKIGLLATGLLLILAFSVLIAIGLGSAVVPPQDTARYLWTAVVGGTITPEELTRYQIVWNIRVPRVLLAAVVGAGLAAVGAAIQALVRNPLADPYILGVSSGASVGAVTVSLFGALSLLGIYAVSVGAFLGALGATLLVYAIAHSRSGITPLKLVLTGVALSFGFQAIMSVLIYFAPSAEATSMVLFWTMGSFGAATWGGLPVVVVVVGLGILVLRRSSRALDVMSLGDESAASLGVDTARTRRLLFAVTAVMTGAMVALSGAIGFVGLVIPHITRMIIGASHTRLLLISPLIGSILMVWVDLLARTVVAPRELPLGALTALIGVPVFILLMRRRGYVFGGR
ncbi:iron ABC transporter permease [Nesterenkonia sp. HG001]|uniref:FecCD family ABC transporter permease n=1 Tax=Nesterenkonia sp. HG001 TaxID=2983207 RepID=UPI002AC4FE23|nr:iron ABC transporter permease [Nesterenkonia sp. HG001]MDZ5079073.1 iron ABC transporter permease [Nesterenkonia sp. HG001]